MKIVDPLPFLGVDSGMRELRVSTTEAKTLLRAVAILERGHSLVNDWDPDHQEGDEIGDALCLAPPAIRHLIDEGLPLGVEPIR